MPVSKRPSRKGLVYATAFILALGATFLFLRFLGVDPIEFALRARYPFLYLVLFVFLVIIGLTAILVKAGRMLGDAYRSKPQLVQRHLEEAGRQIMNTDAESARRLSDSWEKMPAAQKRLFIATYLEERYGKDIPPDLSAEEYDLLAKAYWFSLDDSSESEA